MKKNHSIKKLIFPLTIFSITTIILSVNASEKKAVSSEMTIDSTITLKQVTEDVSFLAGDKLKGRGNFSNDIKIAGNYIAERFKQVGLTTPTTAYNYQQRYTVEKLTPAITSVHLNEQKLLMTQLAMVTNQINISWTDKGKQSIKTHVINQKTKMSEVLKAINSQGGEHLVIVHPSQKKSFLRFQSYFAKGITKLVRSDLDKKPATIVLALSDVKKIHSFTIKATATKTKTNLTNIIGILPGKSKKNEVVLYSAHYDHLGEQTSEDKTNEIFNGANDDASGVSAIINLANHFSKLNNNERTLMFAAFSAEEIGGFGSQYFSKQLEPKAITAMINIEMIGKPAKFGAGTVWMTGMDRSNLGEQLNQALNQSDITIHADPYPDYNLFYRSDNATLARLGVPAHSFSSTQIDKDNDYHQTGDDISTLDLDSMHQVIKNIAIATTPLIKGEVTPSRIDPNLVENSGLIY